MDHDQLADYVEQSQSLIDASPQMDEQNTRRKLVEPFIEVLGWNLLTPEVELEYSVEKGSSPTKVDYALLIEDAPVVLVEAKGLDTTINWSDQRQLTSYLLQSVVDWGLLTNGQTFEVYKRETENPDPDEAKLGSFELDELPHNLTTLRILSREMIETGKAETFAERIEANRQAATTLRNRKTEIADKIIEVVTGEVGDAVSQPVEDTTKQFVDVLAQSLELQADEQVSMEPVDTSTSGSTSVIDWNPEPGANAIAGTISKTEIEGHPNDLVAVFPSKKSGVEFLKENNAWGFVRIGREPDFVAMYISEDVQQIKYIARVKEIVDANQAELARPLEFYGEPGSAEDQAGFDVEKQVVVFEAGSLLELEDPIELGTKWPQGLLYTTLQELKTATKTHDVF